MFKKKQIENISKFLWELAKVMVASGAVAGIMMPSVQLGKVTLAVVMAAGFALFGFILDGLNSDDDEGKEPP